MVVLACLVALALSQRTLGNRVDELDAKLRAAEAQMQQLALPCCGDTAELDPELLEFMGEPVECRICVAP